MNTLVEPSVRLRNAIIDDNLSIALRLLKRFPDLIDSRDPTNGWTLLHYASYHGTYLLASNLIKLISVSGTDDNEVKLTFKRNSYLHLCLMRADNEQVLHLVLQNYQRLIDLQNDEGKTALHLSAEFDRSACLQLLVDFGADLNIKDKAGNTPLHLAMEMGNIKCIKIILAAGPAAVELDVKNDAGFTPKEVANSFDTIKLYEYFQKSSVEIRHQQQQVDEEYNNSIWDGGVAVGTPLVQQKFVFNNGHGSSSASSTPIKTLPPLPSVTTNRRYSNSTTNSNDLELNSVNLYSSSQFSLSSSGSSSVQQQSQPQTQFQQVGTHYMTTPLSRSRSTSIQSEYVDSSPNRNSAVGNTRISENNNAPNTVKKKRSNTLDESKLMDDIEEESKENNKMIKKLSDSNIRGNINILKVAIKGKNK